MNLGKGGREAGVMVAYGVVDIGLGSDQVSAIKVRAPSTADTRNRQLDQGGWERGVRSHPLQQACSCSKTQHI